MNSMTVVQWGELASEASSLSEIQMFPHCRRATAAQRDISEDDQFELISSVQKHAPNLTASAMINLLTLVVSKMVINNDILLSVTPEEFDKEGRVLVQKLMDSMSTLEEEEPMNACTAQERNRQRVLQKRPTHKLSAKPTEPPHTVKKKRVYFSKDAIMLKIKKAALDKASSGPLPVGGLLNPARKNLCFANSLLQCLRVTDMHRVLLQHRDCQGRKCFTCSLQEFLQQGPVSAEQLCHEMEGIWRGYKVGQQQDVHELLKKIMGFVQTDCLPLDICANHHSLSPFHQIFHGTHKSSVSCQECGYVSSSVEIFSDISLPVDKVASLPDAMASYFGGEEIEHRCSRCKKDVQARKQITLLKIPKTLVIHLKRFCGSLRKNCRKMTIPLEMKLRNYVETGQENEEVEDKARLFAVIVHSGKTCTSGHYYAYVQFGTRWYKMDDMRVTEAQSTFLQTLGDQPYLLFYKTLPRPYID